MEYGTIFSPTVIPFTEFEKYKNDLSYYRNIENEGGDFLKHSSVIAYFQKEYIKTEIFEKRFLKYLSLAFQICNNTDYADLFIVSLQDAKEQYERATELLENIEEYSLGKRKL